MLPLEHPEDIDKTFKISSQETRVLFAFVHVADMCIPAQVMCDCYEGPAESLVTGFGLLQCYVLSNIFLLQTFKVFPLY